MLFAPSPFWHCGEASLTSSKVRTSFATESNYSQEEPRGVPMSFTYNTNPSPVPFFSTPRRVAPPRPFSRSACAMIRDFTSSGRCELAGACVWSDNYGIIQPTWAFLLILAAWQRQHYRCPSLPFDGLPALYSKVSLHSRSCPMSGAFWLPPE